MSRTAVCPGLRRTPLPLPHVGGWGRGYSRAPPPGCQRPDSASVLPPRPRSASVLPLWAGHSPLPGEGRGLIVWKTQEKPPVALGWAVYSPCSRKVWRPAAGPLGLESACDLQCFTHLRIINDIVSSPSFIDEEFHT